MPTLPDDPNRIDLIDHAAQDPTTVTHPITAHMSDHASHRRVAACRRTGSAA